MAKPSNPLVLALLILAVSVQFSCGGAGSTSPPPPPPPSFQVTNVFLVVLENHSFSQVIGNSAMPYLNSLATTYGLAANYFANSHPSIGNYFMLTTGQIVTTDDNFTGTINADNVVRELTAAGKTWKGYFDSLPSVGYLGGDQLPYVKHHNPFAYFTDVINSATEQTNIVPATQLAQDIASGQLPAYGFIVPNDYENGHQCSPGITCTDAVALGAADSWLKNNIDPLIKSSAFQKGGLLFIVFDESVLSDTANGGGQVPAVVVGPGVKPAFQSPTFYQHQNLLHTMLQEINVGVAPGAASGAAAMTDFFRAP